MFLTGVLGNLAVCIVIIRNRSMHTATNYYLFSLAIADLLILLLGKFVIGKFLVIFNIFVCIDPVRTHNRFLISIKNVFRSPSQGM